MYRSHDTWAGPDDPQTISLNSAKVFLRANARCTELAGRPASAGRWVATLALGL